MYFPVLCASRPWQSPLSHRTDRPVMSLESTLNLLYSILLTSCQLSVKIEFCDRVVRPLTSLRCGLGSIPTRVPYVGWVCCWFSFCPEGFSPGFRFFSLHKKPTSLNRHINQERGPAWKLPKAPDSLSVTFTADGLRQRLSLIFYSFPVINRYRGMSSAILNPNRVLPKGPQPHVQEPFEAKIYTSADTISSKK